MEESDLSPSNLGRAIKTQDGVARIPPGQYYSKKWVTYAALGIPAVNVEEWKLKVFGHVENLMELTYEELAELPQMKITRDFHCVTRWSIANVEFEGVPFRSLAEEAGLRPEAKFVTFHCLNGYTAVVPLEDALAGDSIIGLKINGKSLSLEQGFPARPYIPQLYGWKSAKWLNGIEFLDFYEDGYWEIHGYHERGNVWEEERFKDDSGKHSPRRSFGIVSIEDSH